MVTYTQNGGGESLFNTIRFEFDIGQTTVDISGCGERAQVKPGTLILGLGNTLLSDEGVGVRTIELMRDLYPDPDIEYIDGGTLGFTLTGYIEQAQRLVVVDAADFKGSAGEYRCFIGDEMDRFVSRSGRSVHEVGLADLLHMCRLTDRLPGRRALFGIQPGTVDWGQELTPCVGQAVHQTAALVWQLVEVWRQS